MKLYGYWRSSASYRVRIALALKGLAVEHHPVNLLAGEQRDAAYLAINPLGLVPALETDDGDVLTQSLAIIEYLEEAYPSPALLPSGAAERAAARAIANTIASEAQPLMNLRIQTFLKKDFAISDDDVLRWLNRWPGGAMAAVEKMVERHGGAFCVGDQPSIADCCLVPQMFAAQRFGIDQSAMPRLAAIASRCEERTPFQRAHPLNQPDAPAPEAAS